MKYHYEDTKAKALAFAATKRTEGYIAYVLTHNVMFYEVRYWLSYTNPLPRCNHESLNPSSIITIGSGSD